MINLFNNDLIYIYLISGIVILTTGYFLKSYLTSTIIETPNSPPTFNFTLQKLKEIEETFDRTELGSPVTLDEKVQDKLDPNLTNILSQENYDQYQQVMDKLHLDFGNELQVIFNNLDLFS